MFKSHPNLINSTQKLSKDIVLIDNKWHPLRPISCPTFFQRIKYSWWVFIGKADALIWFKQ